MNGLTYQDVVAQIKDRLDIVDVVSKHVILKNQEAITGDAALFITKKHLLSA